MKKVLLCGYKILFSLLGFSAIVTEIAILIERGVFTPINFFSYFTVQTNIIVMIVLLLSALFLAAGKQDQLDKVRGATAVYILVVGIGFSMLLANIEGLVLTAVPWDNSVLHYIIPIAILVDLFIDRPVRKLSFKHSLVWLLYPLAYVVYVAIRGGLTGWYPYPFLNPATNGIQMVLLTVMCLFILGAVLIFAVTYFSGLRTKVKLVKTN